jgi:hypothetical protein
MESKTFKEIVDLIEKQSEEKWNALSKEDQLDYFCAVSRRIIKGEIEQKGTYRYVLYNVFGFGPEAYMPAQMAGYLSIHNAIYSSEHERKLLEGFLQYICKKYNMTYNDEDITSFYEQTL